MGMPQTTERWTAAMVRAMPDDGMRHEVVDGGLLVTPAPAWRHQDAVTALYLRLAPWVRERRLGHVIVAPAEIELDPHTLVEPDLFVVPLVGGRKPADWEAVGTLLLAVEVLSPSSARADRIIKRARYQRARFPEYWIVDVDARSIERWRPGDARPEILVEQLTWEPVPGNALTLELDEYFADVWGE